MNRLSAEKRAAILALLCEGISLRAAARIAGVSINTATKLLVDAGRACEAFHDRTVRNLAAKRVQCDRIWSFAHVKARNVAAADATPEGGAGDTWTWTALEADTKLIIGWLVGGRDGGYAAAFVEGVAWRAASRMQLTTEDHKAYLVAVDGVVGCDMDCAMLNKIYGASSESAKGRRWSLAECVGAKKKRVEVRVDPAQVGTSYGERKNLRMRMRRLTRRTDGFSRKIETHGCAIALHFVFYNFVRIHKTLRVTPAMASGLMDRLWEIQDIVALMEAAEAHQPTKESD
jgi:IS1 family transposase